MDKEQMAYIGHAECGCIKLAIVDNPAHYKDTAREIIKAIRQGYVVERVTCEYVRQHWDCPQHIKPTVKELNNGH